LNTGNGHGGPLRYGAADEAHRNRAGMKARVDSNRCREVSRGKRKRGAGRETLGFIFQDGN